jgi:hypothetical protein
VITAMIMTVIAASDFLAKTCLLHRDSLLSGPVNMTALLGCEVLHPRCASRTATNLTLKQSQSGDLVFGLGEKGDPVCLLECSQACTTPGTI